VFCAARQKFASPTLVSESEENHQEKVDQKTVLLMSLYTPPVTMRAQPSLQVSMTAC